MIEIGSEDRSQLIEELYSRIQVINKCIARISAHTSYLINQIGKLSTCAIENLNKLALGYHKLILTNEFSEIQIEESNQILRKKVQLTFDPTLEKLNKIEEYFSQEFFHQSSLSNLHILLQTHTDEIYCIGATNDHKTLISGGDDRCIKLWNVASTKVIKVLEGHTRAVRSIAISKDDGYLVSGSADRTVRVWSLSEFRQLFVLVGHTKQVWSVAISNDCKWIASGSFDNLVCVWSFAEKRLYTKLTEHTSWVRAVAFTENSLFSGSVDGRIIEWNIMTFHRSSVLKAASWVACFDISDDCTQIVSGLDNGKIQLWKNRKLELEFIAHRDWVNAVKFACTSKRIISASDDKTVRVWSIEQRCHLASITAHSHWVTCLAYLGDNLFVSGSRDFSMILFDVSTLAPNSVIRPQPVKFYAIVFDKNRLIYPSENSVMVWNTDKNCVDAEFKGHSDIVECVAFHCNFIVSGSRDCSVHVWNLMIGAQINAFTGHTRSVFAVAISRDIVASGSADKTVRLWSLKTNNEAGVLSGHTAIVRSVALTSSADTVVSSSNDSTVRIWSVRGLQLLFTLTGHTSCVQQVDLSKDNTYIFSASEDEECVRVWKMRSGVQVCCWKNLNKEGKKPLTYEDIRRMAERFLF